METKDSLVNLNNDVTHYIEQFLDAGDLIRLRRAKYGSSYKPRRRWIRAQVKKCIKEKNGPALQSLLREEKGLHQYARFSDLQQCVTSGSFDCYVILWKHFRKYSMKINIPPPDLLWNETLQSAEFNRFTQFQWEEQRSYAERNWRLYLYPLNTWTASDDQLEDAVNNCRDILCPEFIEYIQKKLRDILEDRRAQAARRAAHANSRAGGLVQLVAYGKQDVYQ